ncbi:hypothetical protein QEM13_000182 [Pseudomonas putida]|nr:hypothetical protein [Pseudomonas putida]
MPEREKRYRAYHLLRELDALTSSTMNQVAYGRVGGPEWKGMCQAHRNAFEEWMTFAESLLEPGCEKTPDT